MRRQAVYLSCLVAFLGVVLTSVGCVTDPVTGKRRVSVVRWTPAEELKIGKEASPNIESQFDAVYPDPEFNSYLDERIQEMVKHSVRADDFDFSFKVLNSSIPNAFALPGGFVYITRGLLQLMESEGQFVSIMGHELGHVEHQHSMYNQSRAVVTGTLTAPLRVALNIAKSLPGPTENVVGLAAGVAIAPLAVWGLKYNRAQESESDERGVFFAAEMGYDPREGTKTFEMFERLEKESQSGLAELSWFRTHPLNRDRIVHIQKITEERYPELMDKPPGEFRQGSEKFESILQRFKEQAPAYKLYDEAAAIINNPEVKPAELEKAEEKLREARSLLPEEPLIPIAQGEAALVKEQTDTARTHFEAALELYDRLSPGDSHWQAHFYLGVTQLQAKETKKAIEQLTAARERFPLHPAVHFFLGMAYEQEGDAPQARDSYRQAMDLSPSDSKIYREARDRWRKLPRS